MADRNVAVPVDDAIHGWKHLQNAFFNIVVLTCTMGNSDAMACNGELFLARQYFLGFLVTHISLHRVHLFIGKDGKY